MRVSHALGRFLTDFENPHSPPKRNLSAVPASDTRISFNMKLRNSGMYIVLYILNKHVSFQLFMDTSETKAV